MGVTGEVGFSQPDIEESEDHHLLAIKAHTPLSLPQKKKKGESDVLQEKYMTSTQCCFYNQEKQIAFLHQAQKFSLISKDLHYNKYPNRQLHCSKIPRKCHFPLITCVSVVYSDVKEQREKSASISLSFRECCRLWSNL